jgi:hypothetical protein
MALSREDWIDVTRHLQQHVRKADPEVFELLARHVERWNDPRRYLVDYIDGLMKVMSERSSGSHGRILNELNNWVRTEQGGPIRGIRLVLSPAEQELYRREFVDLASLPDRSAFITGLRELRDDLLREIEESGDRDDTPRG